MDSPTAKRIILGSMALTVMVSMAARMTRAGAAGSGRGLGTPTKPTGNVGGLVGAVGASRPGGTPPGSTPGGAPAPNRSGSGPALGAPIGGLVAAGALSALAGPMPEAAATIALIALTTVLATDGVAVAGLVAGAPARSNKLASLNQSQDYTPTPRARAAVSGAQSAVSSTLLPGTSSAQEGMVTITTASGRFTCSPTIASNLTAMVNAAAAQGVKLYGSCWRSNARQKELRVINGCPDVMTSPASSCRVPTAIPGTSQHEVGLAIDFEDCDYGTPVHNWLKANAARYGFQQLPSESWHWSTTGK